jgi:biopolymer transport protein ExbB
MVILMSLTFTSIAFAQEEAAVTTDSVIEQNVDNADAQSADIMDNDAATQGGGLQEFAKKVLGSGFVDIFVKGGFTMWPLLALTIWGLAYIIWKMIAISYAKVNVSEFLENILPLIEKNQYKDAIEFAKKTRCPVAAVIYAGLLKADRGLDAVEKAIENAGVIEMSYLEKGFIELSTTISLAPMFGFFGTLVGMIAAFDAIEKAGEVEPTIVAGGIKVALITSAAGLAISIPVQFFYNIFTGMVDNLVIDMQRATEKVVEKLIEKKGE